MPQTSPSSDQIIQALVNWVHALRSDTGLDDLFYNADDGPGDLRTLHRAGMVDELYGRVIDLFDQGLPYPECRYVAEAEYGITDDDPDELCASFAFIPDIVPPNA